MNKTNYKLKDHSRYNRWIHNLDEKDKNLTPLLRKSKWVLIVAVVFILFGLSFIGFPTAKIKTETPETPGIPEVSPESVPAQTTARSAFELPVDSFENHLKSMIHETLPEKE